MGGTSRGPSSLTSTTAPSPHPSPSLIPSEYLQEGALDAESWLSYNQVGRLPRPLFPAVPVSSTVVTEVKVHEKAPRSRCRRVKDAFLLSQGGKK